MADDKSKKEGFESDKDWGSELIANNTPKPQQDIVPKITINHSHLEDDPLGLFRNIQHLPDGYDFGDGQYFGTKHGFIGSNDANVQSQLINLAAQYLLDSCGGDLETALKALQDAADSI